MQIKRPLNRIRKNLVRKSLSEGNIRDAFANMNDKEIEAHKKGLGFK
ncbi:MAG: hypothetical protein PHX80_03945 [Candidatus Nanoarchaeia archaeon]|nr:hypothetical protein [Candidatus Nanoarchaeia archaeon]